MAARYQIEPECRRDADEYRALLARVLSSAEFRRATRLREFLTYVVGRKLAGAPEEVTESLIGHRVFGRPAGYNSGEDSIVRTEARILRQRLERYFAGEGATERLVLEIPRGGYLPVFREREAAPPAPLPVPAAAAPAVARALTRRQWIWAGGAAVLAASAAPFILRRAESAAGVPAPPATITPGRVEFESANSQLTETFRRAKQQALSCVFSGDRAGDWYATTPQGESKVFCMRDVAHQSTGAAVLGLHRHTANMLRRFAASIAASRNWCGYFVINKDGFPNPGSYQGDDNFSYFLPANFDLLDACQRQYLWSGDALYRDPVFSSFYDRTVTRYVEKWESPASHLMESSTWPRVRGTYHQGDPRLATGADLVAAQYGAYRAYGRIQESVGSPGSLSHRLAREYHAKADALRLRFNQEWWDPAHNRFQSGLLFNRQFTPEFMVDCHIHTLWFAIPDDGAQTDAELDALDSLELTRLTTPHCFSYLPEILYRCGRPERAERWLLELGSATSFGQNVGDIWFSVIGAMATGMMGIDPDAPSGVLTTWPRLTAATAWARLRHVPAGLNEITIEHRGNEATVLTNHAGPSLRWRAAFTPLPGRGPHLLVDGSSAPTTFEARPNRQQVLTTTVDVKPGESVTVRYTG